MSTIAPCPLCAAKFEMQVRAGMDARGTGRRYICGTIYWLEADRITVRGAACIELERRNREISELQGRVAALEKIIRK